MTEENGGTMPAKRDAVEVALGESGFSVAGLSEVFVKSGFFPDVKAQSQAIVKMLYGQELGLKPIQAMLSIHMVEGHPEVAAVTLGAIIKRSGKYDYRIREHTADVCEIEFFEVVNGKRESLGVSRYEQADVVMAGLNRANSPHVKFPRNMKFCRAMSNGVKWFCLEAVGGVPVYTEGELGDARAPAGADEVAATTAAPATDGFMPRAVDEPDLTAPLAESIRQAQERKATTETVILDAPSGTGKGLALVSRAPVDDDPPPAPEPEPARTQFTINGQLFETAGMTQEHMLAYFRLSRLVDKVKKGETKRILLAEFGQTTSTALDAEQAERFIIRLKEVAGEL